MTKPATSGEIREQHWYEIVRSRAHELASDRDHSLKYHERDKLVKKNMSRQDIVSIYETAYVELAETHAGMEDAYKESQQQHDYLTRENDRKDKYITTLEEHLATANARVNGLLKVIEEPESEAPSPW